MIFGAHFLLYSKDPEADRAFFRDVLGLRFVELDGGWLIFALPPAELAVHPASDARFRTIAQPASQATALTTE
jgi:catechol 2,3-dioxygenase-like lactoylglutathione lyase family enzyme